MSDEAKSFDELAGLLVVTPSNEGNAEADDVVSDEIDAGEPELEADEDGNPDEGTEDTADDEGAEDAEGEATEADAELQRGPAKVTVTVDGKTEELTLDEVVAGYQRQADYTRKTQELAEQRKADEAARTEIRTQRDQYANVLKVLQERLGDPTNDPTPEQWAALRANDPAEYAVQWADHQQRTQQREAVKREQDRVAGEKRQEHLAVLQEHVGKQRELLIVAMPEWKDPVKATAHMKVIREYGSKIGFTDTELDQAYDSRMIIAVDKARKYDAIMAKRADALKKVKGAPEMPAPGARQPAKNAKVEAQKAAQKQLEKTGHIDDAVALMFK